MTKTTKTTTDGRNNPLYLLVQEDRSYDCFRLTARVTTQRLDNGTTVPYGPDDDYSDGLRWSGLEVRCQGDDHSRQRALAGDAGAVYGFDVTYRELYSVDLRLARRLVKTLDKVDKGLDKLTAVRGCVRSYGEYLGRVAEVLGCAGIAVERTQRGKAITGERWRWESIGDGVNSANSAIYRWQQEAVEAKAGEAVAS